MLERQKPRTLEAYLLKDSLPCYIDREEDSLQHDMQEKRNNEITKMVEGEEDIPICKTK